MASYRSYCFTEYDKDIEKTQTYGAFVATLPHKTSPLWTRGFVWKGVFYKLVNSHKAKIIEKMINRMKYLILEFYNNETSKRLTLNDDNDTEALVHFQ